MHPQGAKLTGAGLVGNGEHPVIEEPGWKGGIVHTGMRRRRSASCGRHAGAHSFTVGRHSWIVGDASGGCKIERQEAIANLYRVSDLRKFVALA